MSENREIYTAGKNFILPPAVTNSTSVSFLDALFILDRWRGGEKVDRFWTFVCLSAACHRSEKMILIKKLFLSDIFWQMDLGWHCCIAAHDLLAIVNEGSA